MAYQDQQFQWEAEIEKKTLWAPISGHIWQQKGQRHTGALRVTPNFVGEEAGGHEASEMYFSSFGLAI